MTTTAMIPNPGIHSTTENQLTHMFAIAEHIVLRYGPVVILDLNWRNEVHVL